MKTVLVTGSSGLIGSECVGYFDRLDVCDTFLAFYEAPRVLQQFIPQATAVAAER
ncbi:MAG: hypothetical protein ACXVZM_01590 [Terriglobales bacterium]